MLMQGRVAFTPLFPSISILLNMWNTKRMRAKQAENFLEEHKHTESFPILNGFTALLKYHVIVKKDAMLIKVKEG